MRLLALAAGALALPLAGSVAAQPAPAGATLAPPLTGGSDDCANAATADAIAGNGTFALDTTAATSGAPLASCGFIGRDVWFYWTATASGTALIETCGLVSADSVLAAWASPGPGACPTTMIACLDDYCGVQSRIAFPVAAGTSYYLEVGSFNNGLGYTGALSIDVVPTPTNDSCATPLHVAGNGPHAFVTLGCTSGAEGQGEALCSFGGSSAIHNDAWFTWTAPSSGTYAATVCGAAGGLDTKLAVYAGAGCPAGAAIGCDDDSCGAFGGESVACFTAVQGQTYTLQLGSRVPTAAGSGALSILPSSTGSIGCAPSDDGSSNFGIGIGGGGGLGWLVSFGDAGTATAVLAVRTPFGSPGSPSGFPPGAAVTVAVWDDPNDDGNPADAVLLGQATATVQAASVDTDVPQVVALNPPITANGVFFAGAVVLQGPNHLPAPLDQTPSTAVCGGVNRSWLVGTFGAPLDLANLAANAIPPTSTSALGFPGNWLLRVDCGPGTPGTPYCAGDGSAAPCPCGNASTQPGAGCQHSFSGGSGGAGGLLAATGVPSLGNDTLRLDATQLPPGPPTLFFQGTAQISGGAGIAFGDGLRCAGGIVTRLGQRPASNGAVGFGAGIPGDPRISVGGSVGAPGVRYYQLWYRNAADFCTNATFNLTNGLRVSWGP